APMMPKSVSLPCNVPVKAIHMLSGVSGWGYPATEEETVSLIVRVHYADGATEDHPLRNRREFADYNGTQDVPGSKLAFNLAGRQLRSRWVARRRSALIKKTDLIRGDDHTAPLVMAVTVETQMQQNAAATAAGSASAPSASGKGPG